MKHICTNVLKSLTVPTVFHIMDQLFPLFYFANVIYRRPQISKLNQHMNARNLERVGKFILE